MHDDYDLIREGILPSDLEILEDDLESIERLIKQNIFDLNVVNQILEEQFSGKQDHTYLIFAMLCQQIWLAKQLN